ncbi:MAG: N-acetylmuramoyl-L-alanine amidase [Oscillospiraceae bacterium]|nr:N-acetylmuramoyl-L-alanine amidase [Oscillospiraceae bacterium]
MSNSSLICCTILSPNHSGKRTHAIDTITIHCMAGNLSVESCGALFARSSRQASSNYGIGSDGRIGLYVDEENRSWCTSSRANDQRAITIEVANNGGSPNWPVSAKAYEALLRLVTDICERNNIKRLIWATDKESRVGHLNGCNMTVHRDYANKSCPGNYLYERHDEIAAEVNKRLSEDEAPAADPVVQEIDVGAVVKITGSKYYGGKTIPGWVKAKNWVVHSLSGDRVVINKSEDGKNAIMSPVNIKDLAVVNKAPEKWVPAVGDTVIYNGSVHYISANATSAYKCKGGEAKITAIHQLGKSKHPYHLVRVSGKGASVYGWVDEGTFTKK